MKNNAIYGSNPRTNGLTALLVKSHFYSLYFCTFGDRLTELLMYNFKCEIKKHLDNFGISLKKATMISFKYLRLH